MNGKWHFITTTIIFIALWIIFRFYFDKEYFTISQLIAAIPLTFFPDVDTNFKKTLGHRNWFMHSIILWVIIYILNPYFVFLAIVLAVGLHCLCDLRFCRQQQVGFYCIKVIGDWDLNGRWSTLWLVVNFIVAFAIFSYVVIVY